MLQTGTERGWGPGSPREAGQPQSWSQSLEKPSKQLLTSRQIQSWRFKCQVFSSDSHLTCPGAFHLSGHRPWVQRLLRARVEGVHEPEACERLPSRREVFLLSLEQQRGHHHICLPGGSKRRDVAVLCEAVVSGAM